MTDYDWHPSDDDLVLHFYDELPGEARTRLDDHLTNCAACRRELHAIARTLHLTTTLRAPEPGAEFEPRVWNRLQPHLPRHHRAANQIWTIGAWAATVAAIVAATWTWTNRLPSDRHMAQTADEPAAIAVQHRVLLTAVDDHLTRAEMLFVELLNAQGSEPDAFVYARPMADDLLASGRLYRETARATGDGPVAAVLDDLETVLIEVARSSNEPRVQDLRALQTRILQDDLLFKVRAVAFDVRDRQSRTTAGEGAL